MKPAAYVALVAILAAVLCVGAVVCVFLAAYTGSTELSTAGVLLFISEIALMVVARVAGKPKLPPPPPPPPPPLPPPRFHLK